VDGGINGQAIGRQGRGRGRDKGKEIGVIWEKGMGLTVEFCRKIIIDFSRQQ
jgi:hypothetical protein